MKQMVFLRFEAARFSVDRTAPRDPSSPRRGSHPGLRSMSFSDREAIVSAAGVLPPQKSVETQRISAINRLRLVTSSLRKIAWMCCFTVGKLRPASSAISWLLCPSQTSRTISRSRLVS